MSKNKNRAEKLDKDKLKALHLFEILEAEKIFKTKKARYSEIAKRLKKPVNTITSWIQRYYADYRIYIEEIEETQNAQICNFEGLTEKQTTYIIARLNGKSTEEAKKTAGYSSATKGSDIEKHPKVKEKMEQLREKLFEDTVLGAHAIMNGLIEIADLGKKGIEITETTYHDETNQTLGRITSKSIRKKKVHNLSAAHSALKTVAEMLGYNSKQEDKQKTESTEEVIRVSDKDFL